MYQSLGGQSNSNLIADVLITEDLAGNSSYTYDWEIILPDDVTVEPSTIGGGEAADTSWNFAAPRDYKRLLAEWLGRRLSLKRLRPQL